MNIRRMTTQLTYLGLTQNNRKVYVDLHSSHAATHFSDDPKLVEYVTEALPGIVAEGKNIFLQVSLGRKVGFSDLVETVEGDDIIYAKRLYRDTYTRFVKGRKPVETSYLTLVLHKLEDDYILFSAWLGELAPPFPGDRYEAQDSREFWRHHALVWGKQEIEPGTEMSEWPWGE